MTTEEKIERLIERHEALALSVELVHAEVRDLKAATSDLHQAALTLLTIVRSHENRISNLEARG